MRLERKKNKNGVTNKHEIYVDEKLSDHLPFLWVMLASWAVVKRSYAPALSAERFATDIGLNVIYKEPFTGAGYKAEEGQGYEEMRQSILTLKREHSGEPFGLVVCALHFDGQDAAILVQELQVCLVEVGIPPSGRPISLSIPRLRPLLPGEGPAAPRPPRERYVQWMNSAVDDRRAVDQQPPAALGRFLAVRTQLTTIGGCETALGKRLLAQGACASDTHPHFGLSTPEIQQI